MFWTLFNVPAALLVASLTTMGWFFFRNRKKLRMTPIAATGEFVQGISVLVAILWMIRTLCVLNDPSLLGPEIGFVLVTVFYGTLTKLLFIGYEWTFQIMETS